MPIVHILLAAPVARSAISASKLELPSTLLGSLLAAKRGEARIHSAGTSAWVEKESERREASSIPGEDFCGSWQVRQ
jgi:hypothetical protein